MFYATFNGNISLGLVLRGRGQLWSTAAFCRHRASVTDNICGNLLQIGHRACIASVGVQG
ncbi:hypothetical protein BDZ91DRAFT_717412 [Kalaharituber pfeilii]|nr:hypothetical protein BDZ91DRAFT_717412 [Kalaharituber pfeilii]